MFMYYSNSSQTQEEFRNSCDSLSVQKLLETFIEAKSTGKEKPGNSFLLACELFSLTFAPEYF